MCGYPSICNPTNWSPPGSSTHGIFQGRIQEWHPISYSRYLPNPGIDWNLFSCISCIGRQILYHWHHLENLCICMYVCMWTRQWHPIPVLLHRVGHCWRDIAAAAAAACMYVCMYVCVYISESLCCTYETNALL